MKKIILVLFLVTGVAAFANAQDTTKVKKTPEEKNEHTLKVMQKRLNLTADQSKQISAILAERADKVTKMKGVKGGGLAKTEASTDADKKINALLTDDQKKAYAQMKDQAKAKAVARRKAANAAEPAAAPAE
jgi:protein CpxP